MLVIIPARGGSRGVPGKNLKKLKGKPLIQYTIEAAQEVFKNENILVSTDDTEIKSLAEELGLEVPFLRPAHLASDKSGMYEVLLHSLDFVESHGLKYETIVLLQPTSPFRTSEHILEAIELFNNSGEVDMVTSVKETKSNPYYLLKEENREGFLESSKAGFFVRRQDCPKVWELNGAIYVINVNSLKSSPMHQFKKVKKYVMDFIPSHDIDDYVDWKLAEIFCQDSRDH
ncbi:cytidylyltransferase domain-containing protein [Pontibacter locisalis]|uniref:Cytidylyltransferase domain-containing protein n=1 Tax=Pontibacter locisalis TaxID=1719035 RepID=A0ABW5IQE3_9BACT